MLGKLAPDDQARLIAAMTTIETLLGGDRSRAGETPAATTACARRCRAISAGSSSATPSFMRKEYRWNEPFEGVCAQIVADFVNNIRSEARALLDRRNGRRECRLRCCSRRIRDDVARIRLLLVDPKARGLGLGARLIDECIRFARRAGYKKITLWTHSVLTAARHIYQKAGFKLMRSEEHSSWGRPVVSEHWDLVL